MKSKAKVFYDRYGNRMIFPCYMYREKDYDTIPLETTFWTFHMGLRMATGLEMEDKWYEFDDEKFPHVRMEIGSQGFMHGAATVYLFDGPEFNKILEERAA